jgi:hypothetical protein
VPPDSIKGTHLTTLPDSIRAVIPFFDNLLYVATLPRLRTLPAPPGCVGLHSLSSRPLELMETRKSKMTFATAEKERELHFSD